MSSSRQIQTIRTFEQRYPTDLIRNGHGYMKGNKIQSETVRRLRSIKRTLRVHRVQASA